MTTLQASNNILFRGVTMFASTAILQTNQLIQSMNEIFVKTKGRPWKASARDMRKLVIQGSIVNSAFFMAGNFLRLGFGDETDKEEALDELLWKYVLPVQMMETAFPLVGTAIGLSADVASGKNVFEAMRNRRTAITPLLDKYAKVLNQLDKKEYGNAVGNVLGLGLGINADPFLGMIDYFKDDEYNERDLARIFGIGKSATPESIDKKGSKRILSEEGYLLEKSIKESDVFKANKQLKDDAKKEKKRIERKTLEDAGIKSF